MKKLLTLAAVLGTASLSFGQGFVAFNNTLASRTSTNGTLAAAAPVGTWYYALLVASSTQNTIGNSDGSFTGWTFAGMGTNTAAAGRMTGNSNTDSAAIRVNGYAPTDTADFAIVGWSANIGADFTLARAGFHGFGQNGSWAVTDASKPGGSSGTWFVISTVANDIPLAPDGGPYNSVFGSSAIPGLNMSFVPIPEPSMIALAGLGAAALVIFRRRKA